MDGYTKLHAVILDSSIWLEPMHVRILWITMLAMADANGLVEASVRGLAARARITPEECAEGLKSLSGPDPDSRDGTDGERIREVEHCVWFIINHEKYRDRQTRRQALTAARVRRHRQKCVTGNDVTLGNGEKRTPVYVSVSQSSDGTRESTRGVEAEAGFSEFWEIYDKRVGKTNALKSWGRIKPDDDLLEVILRQARAYVASTPDKAFRKHPATWLNQRGWEDEIVTSTGARQANGSASSIIPKQIPEGYYGDTSDPVQPL